MFHILDDHSMLPGQWKKQKSCIFYLLSYSVPSSETLYVRVILSQFILFHLASLMWSYNWDCRVISLLNYEKRCYIQFCEMDSFQLVTHMDSFEFSK